MNEPQPISDAELDQLFGAARLLRPETARAELAFETRLLARLREEESSIGLWGWRLAPWFAGAVAALALLAATPVLSEGLPVPSAFADWLYAQMLPVV